MSSVKPHEFLDSRKIKYVTIRHSPAYTAQEIAASAHVPGRVLAKTVIVKVDGKMAMAVLPASEKVDLDALREVARAKKVALAEESEFRHLFPGCEVGAMPPFGSLYGMEVFADAALEDDEEIAFNAGSHIELIRMAWKDFNELVQPKIVPFGSRVSG